MLLSLSVLALGAGLRLLAPAPPAAVLRGHLDHAPAGDSVRLEYTGHYGRQRAIKAPLSPAGNFALTLKDLKGGTPAIFNYAGQRTSMYLSPGDQLQFSLDFSRFDETLRYSGGGAAVNNYLAESLYKFEYGPAGAVPRPEYTPATTAAQLRAVADGFRRQRQAFLAAYAQAHSLPADFQRNAALDIDLHWANTLLEYPAYVRSQTKRPAALPAEYFDFLQQLPLRTLDPLLKTDRGLDGNTALMRLLTSYTERLVPTGALSTDPAEAARLYAQATADFGPTAARDRAMMQLFAWKLADNLDGVLAAYPTFRAQNRDSTFGRDLRRMLSQQLVLRPGQPAPAFTLVDHEGRSVSLSELRGKVVYLDFWGTWCGPCLQEMPASLALRQKFAGRDVVFVYIAVGDAEAKWQRVLAAEHLTGPGSVHLRAVGQEVPTRYQVNKYPTYWLIGRDGRIVAGDAPRPSGGDATVAAIDAALAR